jgi:hypothetical protein
VTLYGFFAEVAAFGDLTFVVDLEQHSAGQSDDRGIGHLDERSGIAFCLEAAGLDRRRSGRVRARRETAGCQLRGPGVHPGRLPPPMHQHAHRCEQRVGQGLGAAQRKRSYDQGRQLDRTGAVAVGLEQPVPDIATAAGERDATVLSLREDEVRPLVAEGLTDREIAVRLAISQQPPRATCNTYSASWDSGHGPRSRHGSRNGEMRRCGTGETSSGRPF